MNHLRLKSNIQKIYALKFFGMFLVLMPVIVPFFQSKGIGMKGVFLLQAVFAITVFIMEVPSGYISDLLGRKSTLIVAGFLKAVGFSLFPFADDINVLIFAEIILGIGASLSSGTDIALIYDTLAITDPKKAHIKILGRTLSYLSLGEAVAAFIASVLMLLSVDMQNLAIVSAAVSWIPFFIAFTLCEPARKLMSTNHRENAIYIYLKLFKESEILKLIILNSVLISSGTLFAVWLFQKYWDNIAIPIVYFGFLWAITNLIVSVVSKRAHKIEKEWGSTKTLIIIGILPVIGYFGIALTDSVFGILFCFCFQLTRGLAQIVLKDAINKRISADFRATANSVTQMGVRVVFVIFGPLLGFIIDLKGLSFACLIMGIVSILSFFFSTLKLVAKQEEFIPIR
jgi:MFS family permease